MEKKFYFRDTTDLMVYGHEAWLEMGASHGHAGEETMIYLKYGHNMKIDGLARREGIEAVTFHPDGHREEIIIEEGTPEYHLLKFTPPAEGLYCVVAMHPGNYVIDKEGKYHRGTRRDYPEAVKAVFYQQFAQIIVPAGHDQEKKPPVTGMPLEIRAGHWKQHRAGDVLDLTVMYRNEPLDGVVVDIASDGPGGYKQRQEMTGSDGALNIKVPEPGCYLLIARHRIPAGDEELYDEISLTATLSLMVTR